MKKIIYLFVAFSCVCSVAFAQQEEKRMRVVPEGYMPEAGDLSLGFSANVGGSPIGRTGLIDDLLGRDQVQIPRNLLPQLSIMGKYQLDESTAIRANIGFLGRSVNDKYFVQDDKAVAMNPLQQFPAVEKVIDVMNTKRNGASFAIGAEKQRAYRNVRGFAGASALYAFGKETNSYTYGNAITEINQTASVAPEMPGYSAQGYLNDARPVKISNDNAHAIGLVGVVGVEWFFSPKVSLGGEVNMSFLYQWTPQVSATFEGWNNITQQTEEYVETISPKSGGFYYGTDNLGANLSLNFYF